MSFKKKQIAVLVGNVFAGCVLTAAPFTVAVAQDAQKMERVEITGSNIRRSQTETASPVQTVSREDIEKSGKTSVAELLQSLAVDNQGSVPTTFGNGFAQGASGISLRGLGAGSTLVLINGRRVAPYGLADDGQKMFSDINLIPIEAVERVEILKDGASSIYGSDAIAGVVNVILRRDFVGTVAKVSYGASKYSDGDDTRVSVTHGRGNLATDRYNFLFNYEYGDKGEVWNKDRASRGSYIGKTDLRNMGFDLDTGFGGTGGIFLPENYAAGSAVNGNVRNPSTLWYYNRGNTNAAETGFTRTFPGAACSNFTSHPQGDPGGGCLIDASLKYVQIQPSETSHNIYTRGTFQLSPQTQAYAELNYYQKESQSYSTPSGVSASVGYPGGPVSNAGTALGANHPDNPYFGTAARLRYLAWDVGPRVSNVDSDFWRLVGGLKGTFGEWDYDTAILWSQNKVTNNRTGFLQRDAMRALLAGTGFGGIPAGTYWRIGENAGLNSPALYAVLSPTIKNDAVSESTQLDFKASREFGQLAGGPMGIAIGAEIRHETMELQPTTGTDRGNIVGLGYSAYKGKRDVYAAYAELVAPVAKTVELSAAVRADHYADISNSVTPKLGIKWTPTKEFALRGTYAEGFRAPNPAENGTGGLAAYSTASDPLRCSLGVTAACSAGAVALITSPNTNLDPETSKSFSLGFLWDPLPRTSIGLDLWQIKRKDEIVQGNTTTAIANGSVVRDPSTATSIPGDPGGIIAVLVGYENAASSKVEGLDFNVRQGFDLGGGSKLTFDMNWTHIFHWLRTDKDGTTYEFAGTHGNCDVTNCIGTPDNRINFVTTWEKGDWRVAAIVNYRGSIKNKYAKDDTDCASYYPDGVTVAPSGCKIKSFTTLDLTMRWKASKQAEVFGTILNVLDAKAPFDPLTYGATSYNPLDYYGAMGRFFSAGLKYKF